MSTNPSKIEHVQKLLTNFLPDINPKDPQSTSTLDSHQTQTLKQLISHFNSSDFSLPNNLADHKAKEKPRTKKRDNSDDDALNSTKSEKSNVFRLTQWEICSQLNEEALLRVLRADKWDLEKSKARIEETIVWRRECGCDELDFTNLAADLRQEAETGKMFVLGFDNLNRPIVHMRPRFQNSNVGPKRFAFAFWLIDRAIDLMPRGVESVCFIIDLAGPQESPSLKQQREFVRTLSSHYCERLGQALVINMPTLFVWFLKLLKPVVDPVTFAKAVFDKANPLDFAPAEQLDSSVGGTNGYEFDIETYWPALLDECLKKRQQRLERWTAQAKQVGSSEWDTETPLNNSLTAISKPSFSDPPLTGAVATPPTSTASLRSLTNERTNPVTVSV
ncbi:hypothetical protein O181_043208 [Austropuccinia psidii MF-1]|uniref:CRAL-TRIO domain-containing protein n=1 Tax=Austropuccinia psidii MF-1 TaxID=1389203 RepID=A0A9Q3DKV7_9BASI|nr:hypothetical protein [Austropuccinia psidii MF-1]